MSTPLMRQYDEIKANYKDSILFFRLGDFYEMFNEDANVASRILGIALTSRDKATPMAGVPAHSANAYIAKLIDSGFKVAICEQTEGIDGKIVKREVVKVVTPGTFSDPEFIDAKSNKYILSVCPGLEGSAIAYADLTTGEFKTVEFQNDKDCFNKILRVAPKEIVIGITKNVKFMDSIEEYCKNFDLSYSKYVIEKEPVKTIENFFNLSIDSFGIRERKYAIFASASLLKYLISLKDCSSIKNIKYEDEQALLIDWFSQNNLDMFGKISLFSVIDKSKTAMGARFLRKALASPLVELESINQREEDIAYYIERVVLRSSISALLKEVYDFERAFNRVLRSEANIRDLNVIKKSFKSILNIVSIQEMNINKDELDEIYTLLEDSVLETNTTSLKEGGIIKPTFNKELEELSKISLESKSYILDLETRERERTSIKNLKISYNRIFGYYLEVSNSNLKLIPHDYIRKQTLANCERYITPELKDLEDKVLHASEKMKELEYEIFNTIIKKLIEKTDLFELLANKISYLDFVIGMAELALERNYVKPIVKHSGSLILKDSRHPIVEYIAKGFVSNSITIEEGEIIILTGPNMSGKSTFMKQIALIVILAQIGSYVPASYAEIPIFDKLFTRVGASDDLTTGQSTFMLEMNEVANILNNATPNSLIILDEVGRGTSTYDGISIAKAVTEYIHNEICAKTIFATHYHELNQLEQQLPKVKNYRVEVEERVDKVIFLKKITPGNADKSYGIEVARLAGIPKAVLDRSKYLLSQLTTKDVLDENIEHFVISKLKNIDVNNISLVDLYNIISDLKGRLE